MLDNKVWIVSELYYPIKTSTGYYMTTIAESLAEKNVIVNVITTNATYNIGESPSSIKDEILNGVNVHRILVNDIDKDNSLKRSYRMINLSVRLFFRLLINVKKNDRVLLVTNPAFLILFMPLIKWVKNITYYVLVHDIFPENLHATGKLKSSSLIYKMMKCFFDKAYSKAFKCISIGRDMNKVLFDKMKFNENIELIPSWSEIDNVYPIDKNETNILKENVALENKFIFQFAGNLGNAQGIDNLLEAIELCEDEHIHFLFIGGGAKYETIARFAKVHSNVTLLGFRDRSEQNDFLNACDVSIITLADGMLGLGVPSKFYNIIASGKPILNISDKTSEVAMCVDEYGIGWNVQPNCPRMLADTFELIFQTSKVGSLDDKSQKAREVAEKCFAKHVILEKYYQLFK